MISHELKCIFVHIPRTAGTSIEKTLTGKNWWFYGESVKHPTIKEAHQLYKKYWDDYFKFTIVRNPFDRLVSQWRWFNKKNKNITRFAEFDTFVRDYKPYYAVNIIQYHKILALRNKKFEKCLDFIGRFENLDNDFKVICDKLGIEKKLPIVNKTRHEHYREYYSEELKKIVSRRYRKDLAYFNYEF